MKIDINKYLDKYSNSKYLKIAIPIIVIIIFIAALIGAFTFLKPADPSKLFNDSKNRDRQEIPFENRPGIKDVKKISDVNNKSKMEGDTSGNKSGRVSRPVPVRTPKPLPYPRIEINYTQESTNTIGGESTEKGYMFVIVKMDIRNYGYKYFDAHPTKFRIYKGGNIIVPIVNVSTTNTIDAVIPNNSRAKGDVIFLLKSNQAVSSVKMRYISDSYKILFNAVSSIEDKIEDEDEDGETSAAECNDYNYEEGKCYD